MESGIDNAQLLTDKNYRWIYTYDYAPDSKWDSWRESVYEGGGLDENGVPYWISDEADTVLSRINGTLPAYILLGDSHFAYNGTWDDTIASMRAVADRISIEGIIHIGDLSDGIIPAADTIRLNNRLIADMKHIHPNVYLVPGNHDYNYFRGNPEIIYPKSPQKYYDNHEQRLRIIIIDSFDPMEEIRYGFTDYCVHWLDAVLRMMPADYTSIILSHVPPLVRLQAYTDSIRNREKLMAVLDKYAYKILALISGHTHCDSIFNELYNGQFPILTINCAKCECFTELKPEGAVLPFRRLGDRTQECFDVMQVDTQEKKVYFTRFGAGEDRMVINHKAVWKERRRG